MLHEILERLDKVKKFGGKYLACCPVHNDRNPSMSVTEKDNKVLIYCHACGASGLDVVEAIGLDHFALFNDQPKSTGIKRRYSKKQIDEALEDAWYIQVYESELEKNYRPSREEYRRYKLSLQRVKVLDQKESA